jgi:hypothetical protein
MTSTIHEQTAPALLMALELGRREWKVGFGSELGRSLRRRSLRADSWRRVAEEIAAAKAHLGVSAEAPVISCYEAGLDGFLGAPISDEPGRDESGGGFIEY